MIRGVKSWAQKLDTSSDFSEIRHRPEPEIQLLEGDFSASVFTQQSVKAKNKPETESILKQVEKLYALVAERNELETAGSSVASGWRCEDTSKRSADNGYNKDSWLLWSNMK